MFCRFCGEPISDDAKYCPRCGGETPADEFSAAKAPMQIQIIQGGAQNIQKAETPTAAKVLIALVAFGILATFLGIVIPIIGSKRNDKEAFGHAWSYDLGDSEIIYDFPNNTMIFKFNDTSIDFEMDWKLKGRVLTLSIKDDDPENYKVSFSNHRRTMRLASTEDEWDIMTLRRIG
ncbi:MAG: zinc-ribbon domain-containing protein [Oscillospiraceae bacterium]|nr:zinc-ribbon domain-containing protein [Oscillospiraceae bacterium]